jgi:integrase
LAKIKTPTIRKKAGGYELRKMIGGKQYSIYRNTREELHEEYLKLLSKTRVHSNFRDCTLSDFLVDYFDRTLRAVKRGEMKARATKERRRQIEKYVLPYLGHIKLSAITAPMVRDHFEVLADEKIEAAEAGQQTGTRSLQLAFETLRAALSTAEDYVNPLIVPRGQGKSRGPRPAHKSKPKVFALNVAQCNALLTACRKHPTREGKQFLYTMVFVALQTGMRIGELFALQVRSIDFDKSMIHVIASVDEEPENCKRVISTPKTATSVRSIQVGHDVMDLLRTWVEGMADDALVFGNKYGQITAANNFLRRYYQPAVAEAGLAFDFHSLRHTHVSVLIKKGWDYKKIQKRLGHAKASITMDTYAHLFDEPVGADTTLDGVFGASA